MTRFTVETTERVDEVEADVFDSASSGRLVFFYQENKVVAAFNIDQFISAIETVE